MSDKQGRYERDHKVTPEWPVEKQINDLLGVPKNERDIHHETIKDTKTSDSGKGNGWTRTDAERDAWKDLKSKNK